MVDCSVQLKMNALSDRALSLFMIGMLLFMVIGCEDVYQQDAKKQTPKKAITQKPSDKTVVADAPIKDAATKSSSKSSQTEPRKASAGATYTPSNTDTQSPSAEKTAQKTAPKEPLVEEVITGQKGTPSVPITAPTAAAPSSPPPVQSRSYNPKSWGLLLQNAKTETLLAHPRDLYVIDIDDAQINGVDLSQIRKDDVLVISYLSIGEAEDYRSYWQGDWKEGSPGFLEKENPDWQGNYKVRYWDPSWRSIMRFQLDRIIAAGYDGVYLDIIDGYEYFQEQGIVESRQRMVDLVKYLSSYAKSKNKGFLIIPQNSPEIAMDYIDYIDGVGKETTWYEEGRALPAQETDPQVELLDQIRSKGKFVLAIDYFKSSPCAFFDKARDHGFVPTAGPRELDYIVDVDC